MCLSLAVGNATPSLSKGQVDKSKSASVSGSIYHCNKGQRVRSNQNFVPDVCSSEWMMWSCIKLNFSLKKLIKAILSAVDELGV